MRTVGLMLLAALLFPSPALPQPSETHWLVGRWDGSIANYPGAGSAARTLEVTKVDSDGRAEAIWYITGQRTAPAQVKVMRSLMGLKGGKIERLKGLDPKALAYVDLVQQIQLDLEQIDASLNEAMKASNESIIPTSRCFAVGARTSALR